MGEHNFALDGPVLLYGELLDGVHAWHGLLSKFRVESSCVGIVLLYV